MHVAFPPAFTPQDVGAMLKFSSFWDERTCTACVSAEESQQAVGLPWPQALSVLGVRAKEGKVAPRQ